MDRRTWYPKLKMLKGKGATAGTKADQNQTITHSLSDKSIADVCEALIGAAFMQHNQRGHWTAEMWDQPVKAVTKLVVNQDHVMEHWGDYYKTYQLPKYQLMKATAAQLDLAAKVEKQWVAKVLKCQKRLNLETDIPTSLGTLAYYGLPSSIPLSPLLGSMYLITSVWNSSATLCLTKPSLCTS